MNNKPRIAPLSHFAALGSIDAAVSLLEQAQSAVADEFPVDSPEQVLILLKRAFELANASDGALTRDVLMAHYRVLRGQAG
jgi:hypothetical protein